LRAERDAVHHAAFGADAGAVTSLVHLVTHLVSLALEGAKDLVALPDGAALARLFNLARVAAVDGLDRRRAHRVALEKTVFTDAPLNATILPNFAVLVNLAVVNARKRTGFLGSGPLVAARIS